MSTDDVAGYGDISAVKMKHAGMSNFDISCFKDSASFWLCKIDSYKPLQPPLSLELTDSAGRVLVGNNVITNFAGGEEFDFGSNFPDIPPATPTPNPTPAPTTPSPTSFPTVTAKPSGESKLLTTMNAKNAWEVFEGLTLLTKVNNEFPPSYSLVAE